MATLLIVGEGNRTFYLAEIGVSALSIASSSLRARIAIMCRLGFSSRSGHTSVKNTHSNSDRDSANDEKRFAMRAVRGTNSTSPTQCPQSVAVPSDFVARKAA